MGNAERANKLDAALRRLYSYGGVQRSNLVPVLSEDLIQLFRIESTDSSKRVRDKITWGLEWLIRHLKDSEDQIIARYTFNITRDPNIEVMSGATQRQEAMSSISARTAQDRISNVILPAFVRDLLNDPPAPMSEREQELSAELVPSIKTKSVPEAHHDPSSPGLMPKPESIKTGSIPGVQRRPVPLAGWLGRGDKTTDMQKSQPPTWILWSIAGGLFLLVVIIVSISLNSGNAPNYSSKIGTSSSREQEPATEDVQVPPEGNAPVLVFSDLRETGVPIMVYPGVSESEEDKQPVGFYPDSQVIGAVCKTKGRTAYSNPQLGDQRSSDDWIRVAGTQAEKEYVSTLDVEYPEALLPGLPGCR
jgi:hypothetical protein